MACQRQHLLHMLLVPGASIAQARILVGQEVVAVRQAQAGLADAHHVARRILRILPHAHVERPAGIDAIQVRHHCSDALLLDRAAMRACSAFNGFRPSALRRTSSMKLA